MSLAGLEPAVVFPARVLSPAHIPILLQRHILFDFPVIEAGVRIYRTNASEGSRTLTEPGLSRLPLPVGIREQNSGQGRTRTFGVSHVTDLSPPSSPLGIPAHKNNRLRGVLRTGGLTIDESS